MASDWRFWRWICAIAAIVLAASFSFSSFAWDPKLSKWEVPPTESIALQRTGLRALDGRWKIVSFMADGAFAENFPKAGVGSSVTISSQRIDFAGHKCLISSKTVSRGDDPDFQTPLSRAYDKKVTYRCASKGYVPEISFGKSHDCILASDGSLFFLLRRVGSENKGRCPRQVEFDLPRQPTKWAKASCHVTAGARKADRYVKACETVMTSVHAPCSDENTCENILSYIKDRCQIQNWTKRKGLEICAEYVGRK